MKKLILILLLFIFFYSVVNAEERTGFIDNSVISINDQKSTKLNDNNYKTYEKIPNNTIIKIDSNTPFSYIYVIYYVESKLGQVTYNNKKKDVGENDYMHELIKLDEETAEALLNYNDDVKIKEIFLFSTPVPDWVQDWQPPCDDADLLLFSTHSDDEHIFFAGLIPTMLDRGKKVEVIYTTRHEKSPHRIDELLNGLWAVGLHNYPVIGIVPDAYSMSLKKAISNLSKAKLTVDDLVKFDVDMIRRFKPEVIVTHDENGEYGHGQHRLTTHAIEKAVPYLNDAEYNSLYPPFEPYKVYIHLYKDNPITMNYDIPLKKYNGKTAYEVSMIGFKEHVSQNQWRWKKLFSYKSATEFEPYSPLYFGLYYSNVGYENVDNNMFYNIPETILIEGKSNMSINNIASESKKNDNKLLTYTIIFICSIFVFIISIIVFAIATIKSINRK